MIEPATTNTWLRSIFNFTTAVLRMTLLIIITNPFVKDGALILQKKKGTCLVSQVPGICK